jgi:hypothetical protein
VKDLFRRLLAETRDGTDQKQMQSGNTCDNLRYCSHWHWECHG